MKYKIAYTKQFKKDIKLAAKQHKDLNKVFHVIELLAEGYTLPKQYKEHILKGKYAGMHECHIESDWLLIWDFDGKVLIFSFYRLGSHSELFKK